MDSYEMILYTANQYYNRGLEQAKIRDLSGAEESLKTCLKYNKFHTQARNLLGLVYFEVGETVKALSEWVISKNLEADNPLADKYLDEVQNTPGMLDKLNQTTKKYNQALIYCKQGSRDMASIQLRKVLNMNPKFVAGHQLLALLYMQDGKYNDARKELSAASKIDVRNTITLRYSKEVRERLKEQSKDKKKKKDDLISIQDGNDVVVMPNSSFMDMLDSSRSSILNILTGLIIGLLICFFLVVPTVKQRANDRASRTLVNTNEELSNSSTNVSQLKKKVESQKKELEQYTGKADAVGSYEQLMTAKAAIDAGDMAAATEAINQVNPDLLSDKGKAQYNEIHTAVYAEILSTSLTEADKLFGEQNFEGALGLYTKIVDIQEDYNEGKALFNKGECQWKLSQRDDAIKTFKRVLELHPEGELANQVNQRLEETQ